MDEHFQAAIEPTFVDIDAVVNGREWDATLRSVSFVVGFGRLLRRKDR